MQMDAATWETIVTMTKAAIARWQASSDEKGCADKFTVHVASKDGRTALLTKHMVKGYPDGMRQQKARCIMRFDDTGSVFPCKWDRKAKKWKAAPAPQTWIKAQGKSPEAIMKVLKMDDFIMFISASFGAKAAPEISNRENAS